MRRFGTVIRLKPENVEEYERLHADVWPGVLTMIGQCNIRNYSIFRLGELLFGYYEYIGDDHEADTAMMAADPITQEWWKVTGPCQRPVDEAHPSEWWASMKEVFHYAGPLAETDDE